MAVSSGSDIYTERYKYTKGSGMCKPYGQQVYKQAQLTYPCSLLLEDDNLQNKSHVGNNDPPTLSKTMSRCYWKKDKNWYLNLDFNLLMHIGGSWSVDVLNFMKLAWIFSEICHKQERIKIWILISKSILWGQSECKDRIWWD